MKYLQQICCASALLVLVFVGISPATQGQDLRLQKPIGEYQLVPEYTIRTTFQENKIQAAPTFTPKVIEPSITLTDKKRKKRNKKVSIDITGEETKHRLSLKVGWIVIPVTGVLAAVIYRNRIVPIYHKRRYVPNAEINESKNVL